ncbi:HERC2, partial [Symbiodinium sp. KB8]
MTHGALPLAWVLAGYPSLVAYFLGITYGIVMGMLLSKAAQVPRQLEATALPASCDVVSIGAGWAGVYTAFRRTLLGSKVCIFEASHRVGGRTYSHKLVAGKKKEPFTLDVGAYRFSPVRGSILTVRSMSLHVEVGLISGRKATVQVALDETLGTLERRAQVALGVRTGRLLDSSGSVVEGCVPIKRARVLNGDSLTLLRTNMVQVQASGGAFAAVLGDGSVVTWGAPDFGGHSSAVQDQLKAVQQISACRGGAFAAILVNGSVVTWGCCAYGGDSSAVQTQLKNVQQIQACRFAFAAILDDGSVVTWGKAEFGGDSSAVQAQLKNVRQIQASSGSAFAAILGDGSVVTWGPADCGGDSSAVQGQLKNVQQIQASYSAFAAILGDGSVVTWGNADGGDSRAAQDRLKNVEQIQATVFAFAAILDDGSVVTWGDADSGGDSSAVQTQLKNVQQIQASYSAFAAILGDGSVVTWGHAEFGADSSAVQTQLKNVIQIQASERAFAAILDDGSVVTCGDEEWGGDSSSVQGQLKNVQQIQACGVAFAAVLGDGSVVSWGRAEAGGDNSAVQGQLKNVQQIHASDSAFAAILDDGSVVTWGDAAKGGDSSGDMHLPGDVILKVLGLPTACYEPDCPAASKDFPAPFHFNYTAPLRRIVDAEGMPAGYVTAIDGMLKIIMAAGGELFLGANLTDVQPQANGTQLVFGNEKVHAKEVMLNLPRTPFLSLPSLRAATPNRTISTAKCVKF